MQKTSLSITLLDPTIPWTVALQQSCLPLDQAIKTMQVSIRVTLSVALNIM